MSIVADVASSASASFERIRFAASGVGLVCAQAAARELAPIDALSRVPNTPGWMRGLMNARGSLVPVIDLGQLFVTEPVAPSYVLVFAYADSGVGLLVDALPTWCTVCASQRLSRVPACPDILRAHVVEAYFDAQRAWFDIDIVGLLRSLSELVAN